MSKPKFRENIKCIAPNLNAYCRIVKDTSHACIVIHEHLGLVLNIVQTTQFFIGNKISLIVPDLFMAFTSKSLLNNEFDAIRRLKLSQVLEAIQACVAFAQKNHKKLILVGFSVGAAFGFKILEKLPSTFETAFLFYGTPDLKSFNPTGIKTTTISFYGTEDKIKYLSDYGTYKQFMKKCKSNPQIKFQQMTAGHGYANPGSDNFSEEAVVKSRLIMRQCIPEELIDDPYYKEEKSSCTIY